MFRRGFRCCPELSLLTVFIHSFSSEKKSSTFRPEAWFEATSKAPPAAEYKWPGLGSGIICDADTSKPPHSRPRGSGPPLHEVCFFSFYRIYIFIDFLGTQNTYIIFFNVFRCISAAGEILKLFNCLYNNF